MLTHGGVRPLLGHEFLTHDGVRPLFRTCKFLTHGGVRPLQGLIIANPWWGPSSFGLLIAVV